MTFTLDLKFTNSSTFHQQRYRENRCFDNASSPSSDTELEMAISRYLTRQINTTHMEDTYILHLNTKGNYTRKSQYTAPDI